MPDGRVYLNRIFLNYIDKNLTKNTYDDIIIQATMGNKALKNNNPGNPYQNSENSDITQKQQLVHKI